MNLYETAVILNPNLSEEEVKSAVQKITGIVTSDGGEVLKIDNWGKRKLAYELNKQKIGLYIFFLFKAPPQTIKKIESYFKVYDIVVKFMVIKLTKHQIDALPKSISGDIPISPEELNNSEAIQKDV